MRRKVREEATRRPNEVFDAARQSVGSNGGLHQAPDAFRRVGLMRGIRWQPEQGDARMDLQPGLNHFRGMRWRVVEGQRERTLGVDLHEALEKGNKMHRQ